MRRRFREPASAGERTFRATPLFRPLKRAHKTGTAFDFPQLKVGGYGSHAGFADDIRAA
ncbi:MAG: hypothetical protein QOE82_479 [Thermoanaerobaculia bacterium]|nr:hypothetical protein [Thermoanaerobaculia bacterium]